jgi:hypothetical protein
MTCVTIASISYIATQVRRTPYICMRFILTLTEGSICFKFLLGVFKDQHDHGFRNILS